MSASCFRFFAFVALAAAGCGRDPLDYAGDGTAVGADAAAPGRRNDAAAPGPEVTGGLVVVPGELSLPLSTPQRFQAYVQGAGRSTDVTAMVTWSASDPTVLQVSPGGGAMGPTVVGLKAGATTLLAQLANVGTATARVTVVARRVVRVQVGPPSATLSRGAGQGFDATAVYDDGHTASVTTAAVWASSNPGVAAPISDDPTMRGFVRAAGPGTATISAKFALATGSATVTVAGAEGGLVVSPRSRTAAVGEIVAFTASWGGTSDVTRTATWSSSSRSTASSQGGGQFRCAERGTVSITASYQGNNDNATLSCGDGAVRQPARLRLTGPPDGMIRQGVPTTLSASVVYSDDTEMPLRANQVTWTSLDTSVATVSSQGVVRGERAGKATITAAWTSGGVRISGEVALTIL